MKKKILSLLLVFASILGLTGCGNEESKYSIGDKVSTDLVEFTIENSKLTLAIDSEGNAKDYEENSNYKYVASKGHVYASFTFILKNLDRSKLEVSNNFITVKYNRKESNSLKIISSSEDLAKWNVSSKISLNSGKELTYRAYIDIDCDAKDLEDDFNVMVELPKSDGTKETFNFLINKTARTNAKIREISLETAIQRYPLSATLEYFVKHLNDFESLNGTQITQFVKSNDGDRYIKFGNNNYKHYEFRDKGIDGNLIIWPGGSGASALMYSVDDWSVNDDILKISSVEYVVKKLNDNYYLLINKSTNSISGLMR